MKTEIWLGYTQVEIDSTDVGYVIRTHNHAEGGTAEIFIEGSDYLISNNFDVIETEKEIKELQRKIKDNRKDERDLKSRLDMLISASNVKK